MRVKKYLVGFVAFVVSVVAGFLFAAMAWPGERGDAEAFGKLFARLEGSGSIRSVLNRNNWPDNDFLASYLEYELLYHPSTKTKLKDLQSFLRRWPNHPQVVRVEDFVDQLITTQGSDAEALAWYDRSPPSDRNGRLRYLKLLLMTKREAEATVLWRELYREGVGFSKELDRQLNNIWKKLTQTDREVRARVFLRRGKDKLFDAQIYGFSKDRKTFFRALREAREARKKFNALVKKLPKKMARDPELWKARISGLRKNGYRQKAARLLMGREGKRLTEEARQKLRYYLGRDLIYLDEDYDRAFELLDANVREKGGKLQDSLWLAAWSAYQGGKRWEAQERFIRLALEASATRRRSQGAYWAARTFTTRKRNSKENSADRAVWLKYATKFPETFYGLLAQEELYGELKPLVEAPRQCRSFDDNREIMGRLARFELLERAGRGFYKGMELDQLAQEFNLTAMDRLCLALDYDTPHIATQAARDSGQKNGYHWRGMYPKPPWNPAVGWNLEPNLVLAMGRQESLFFHRALSRAGAMGVLQLMPATAREEAEKIKMPEATRFRLQLPPYNLSLGQSYLKRMLRYNKGDLVQAFVSYNAGPGRAKRWRPRREREETITYIENIPITETRLYVKKVIHGFAVYELLDKGQASLDVALRKAGEGNINYHLQ
ncbi:MAG: lytic transglycosylase domain-containing protein [Magnetococcales bacterium]|nr:lytic transglycosylase domain-containing protein [Magnetococcales bacterium]